MNEKIKRKFEKEKFLASLRPVIIRSIAGALPSPIEYISLRVWLKRQKGKLRVLYTLSQKKEKNRKTQKSMKSECVCVGGGLEDDDAHTIPNGLYYTHQSAT